MWTGQMDGLFPIKYQIIKKNQFYFVFTFKKKLAFYLELHLN